jgi:hypothetical protein
MYTALDRIIVWRDRRIKLGGRVAEARIIEVNPAFVFEEVDAMAVTIPTRRRWVSPEAIPSLITRYERNRRGNRERRVVIVIRARREGRLLLAQATLPNYDCAPERFAVCLRSPMDDEAAAVNKHPLAMRHLLKHLIPPTAHPASVLEHVSHVVPVDSVLKA